MPNWAVPLLTVFIGCGDSFGQKSKGNNGSFRDPWRVGGSFGQKLKGRHDMFRFSETDTFIHVSIRHPNLRYDALSHDLSFDNTISPVKCKGSVYKRDLIVCLQPLTIVYNSIILPFHSFRLITWIYDHVRAPGLPGFHCNLIHTANYALLEQLRCQLYNVTRHTCLQPYSILFCKNLAELRQWLARNSDEVWWNNVFPRCGPFDEICIVA